MTDAQGIAPVILFVDDEVATAKYFQRAINTMAPVITAGSVEEGKRALDAHADTLLILVSDQRMPGEYGNELLRYARERYPQIIRILATAYSELENTVEAINEGQIHRYLKKPLDLNTLRIELKSILELASLRKERDQLVREKLIVRHNQTVAHRIGMLSAISNTLSSKGSAYPINAYLTAAMEVGFKAPEADWLLMDYSDLVSAEAKRAGEFGKKLRARLEWLTEHFQTSTLTTGLKQLGELLGDKIRVTDAGTAIVQDELVLTEFLTSPCTASLSDSHVDWLAFIIWFAQQGGAISVSRTTLGLECSTFAYTENLQTNPLEVWIEQF
jgi:two-component system probable response regulator PhcQ